MPVGIFLKVGDVVESIGFKGTENQSWTSIEWGYFPALNSLKILFCPGTLNWWIQEFYHEEQYSKAFI